jgi:hypothetical protein
MKPSDEANFLYEWTRKRAGGLGKVVLLGVGAGAAAGLFFAILMAAATPDMRLNEDEMAPFVLVIARAMGPLPFLFLISIGAFAGLGAFLAYGVWRRMEGQYHALISAGHRPPARKPVFTLKQRLPGLIVVGFFVLLCIWLIGMMLWEINRGAL